MSNKRCQRLGLPYEAVIGCDPPAKCTRFRLKLARRGSRPDKHPPSEPPEVEELRALIRDGASLLAVKGWGAPEVGPVYLTAVALADKLVATLGSGMSVLRFEAGIGSWSHRLVRGDLVLAETEANRLLAIAERNDDRNMRIVACRASGTNALWLGDFAGAESFLRKSLEALEGFDYRPYATDLGAPPSSLVSADLADILWVLGRYREALATIHRACERASSANYYFQHCYALTFSTWIRFKLGQFEAAFKDAGELQERARLYGLAAIQSLGKALEGLILAFQAEDPSEGIGRMYEGLGAWRANGSELLVCYFYTDAARAWLRCGHGHAAALEMKKAVEVEGRTGERYYRAEMLRLQGDIEWVWRKNFAGAEAGLREALEVASEQQSLTYRLRAAMSLLQLARARDDLGAVQKRQQIGEREILLELVYDSFVQEHDSADLQAARSLLAASTRPATARRRRKKP